jgi:hypothetical protein
VFVITHYAPRLADGRPDTFTHGLENAEELLRICADLPRAAILHGHVHRCFSVAVPGVRPTIFGAGSTTQDHREGLWLFDVGPAGLEAARGTWEGAAYALTTDRVRIEWPEQFLAAV